MAPYVDLDLTAASLHYGTILTGGVLMPGDPGVQTYSYASWPMVLDPTKAYSFVIDTIPPDTYRAAEMYSMEPGGDPDASDWWTLGYDTEWGTATETEVQIGPGTEDWTAAHAAGENRFLIGVYGGIARVQWKELAVTYSEWMTDATPINVNAIVNRDGGDIPANTWGWQSTATLADDADPAARMGKAWGLIGSVTTGSPTTTPSVTIPGGTTDAIWQASWMTIDRPDVTAISYASSTIPIPDPAAVTVEWAPATTPTHQELEVSISGISSTHSGRSFDVKLVDNVTGRFEPGPLTAASMAEIVGTSFQITPVGDIGPLTETVTEVDPANLTIKPAGGGFAIALLDYYSATQTATPFTPALTYGPTVTLRYKYVPLYRYMYYEDPDLLPTVLVVPPLRQWPRSDGHALSSSRRVYPNTPSVQKSLRQGPGAYL